MIEKDLVDKFEDKLKKMAKSDPLKGGVANKKALLKKYQPQILGLLKDGWTNDDITEALNEVGIKIEKATVNQYIRELHSESKVGQAMVGINELVNSEANKEQPNNSATN